MPASHRGSAAAAAAAAVASSEGFCTDEARVRQVSPLLESRDDTTERRNRSRMLGERGNEIVGMNVRGSVRLQGSLIAPRLAAIFLPPSKSGHR